MATASQKIAHGELGREITLTVSRALAEKRAARGLELLRLICAYYAANRTAERTHSTAATAQPTRIVAETTSDAIASVRSESKP